MGTQLSWLKLQAGLAYLGSLVLGLTMLSSFRQMGDLGFPGAGHPRASQGEETDGSILLKALMSVMRALLATAQQVNPQTVAPEGPPGFGSQPRF